MKVEKYQKLPFSIKKLSSSNSKTHEFKLTISSELANQLTLIAAPFLQDLANSMADRARQEIESKRHLRSMLDENIRINMVAIKALRSCRRNHFRIEEIANQIGMDKNMYPQTLINTFYVMQKRRFKRLMSFRDRKIIRSYNVGAGKKQIAGFYKIYRTGIK